MSSTLTLHVFRICGFCKLHFSRFEWVLWKSSDRNWNKRTATASEIQLILGSLSSIKYQTDICKLRMILFLLFINFFHFLKIFVIWSFFFDLKVCWTFSILKKRLKFNYFSQLLSILFTNKSYYWRAKIVNI